MVFICKYVDDYLIKFLNIKSLFNLRGHSEYTYQIIKLLIEHARNPEHYFKLAIQNTNDKNCMNMFKTLQTLQLWFLLKET